MLIIIRPKQKQTGATHCWAGLSQGDAVGPYIPLIGQLTFGSYFQAKYCFGESEASQIIGRAVSTLKHSIVSRGLIQAN